MESVGCKRKLASTDHLMLESRRPRLEQSPDRPPSSTYGKPMPFNLQRKVFLSHSGKDKEFVRHLSDALCQSYHGIEVAFFDEDSIPKGEAVTMENILEEARTCKLGVLVLTDDFFTHTRNPMLELEAFVAAEVKLLPLFFTMSVAEFKEKDRRDRWVTKWREWSAVGDRPVNLERWEHALSLVSTFSGLEFCKIATNQRQYIEEVVKQVNRIIGPAIPLSEGGTVHGKDRLCKMVEDMYEKAASKRFLSVQSTSNTQVASTSVSNSSLEEDCTCFMVGIHGFQGLGKTTLCKWLCDFYYPDLSGRVCYIDVGSLDENFRKRLEHVLSTLSPGNKADALHHFQYLSIDQLTNLLDDNFSSMRDPVFLAIDNVLDKNSEEEAAFYLSRKLPKDSKILITSRSERVLANLSDLHKYNFLVEIAYMPPLTYEEASALFVYKLPKFHNLELKDQQLKDLLKKCVSLCTIHKERYHPMMLKSLAAFIMYNRASLPNLDWKGRLAKLQAKMEEIKDDVWEKVYTMFDATYDLLSGETQKVFLDMALFYSIRTYGWRTNNEWINMLHSNLGQKKLEEIILQLQDVSFLERKSLGTLEILDLLVDFAKYKTRYKGIYLNTRSEVPVHRTYLVMDDSTEVWPDPDYLPNSARHINISGVHSKVSESGQLDLRGVEGVEVLHLVHNLGLQEVLLSPTTCAHLRSLIVIVPSCTTLRCTLPSCQFLKWMQLEGNVYCAGASQVPGLLTRIVNRFHFLKKLNLVDEVAAKGSRLDCPVNLEVLDVSGVLHLQRIDTTDCVKLKSFRSYEMPSLKSVLGLGKHSLHLEKVFITDCDELLKLTISANSGANHSISSCPSLKRICFEAGSKAESRHTSSKGRLGFTDMCPEFQGVADALAQYEGGVSYNSGWEEVRLEDFFGRFPIKDAGVDSALCKARVVNFSASKDDHHQAGLAGVQDIELEDAQHAGVFISALFEAQPKGLQWLKVVCRRGGDCGCNQNAPHFLPLPASYLSNLEYKCPQVRDLASLAQCNMLQNLNLEGCTSVEVWPDFAAMTLLEDLNLSNTSLKKWPTAVRLFPRLRCLNLRGCRELPAKELIMNGSSTTAVPESMRSTHLTCKVCSLQSLIEDLTDGTRDRGSVADDLDALALQLVLLFKADEWPCTTVDDKPSSAANMLKVQNLVVKIMSLVWLGHFPELEEKIKALISATAEEWQNIGRKMRGLLCSKKFQPCSVDAGWALMRIMVFYKEWCLENKQRLEVEEVQEYAWQDLLARMGLMMCRKTRHVEKKQRLEVEEVQEYGAWQDLLARMGLKGIPLVELEAMDFEYGGASCVDRDCVISFLQIPYCNFRITEKGEHSKETEEIFSKWEKEFSRWEEIFSKWEKKFSRWKDVVKINEAIPA